MRHTETALLKRVSKIIRSGIILFISLIFFTGCEPEEYSVSFFAMDTYMSVSANGGNAGKAISEAVEEIKRLDGLWSAENEKSEIYALNHEKQYKVSGDTAEILRMSFKMSEKTEGAFDITLYPIIREWGFIGGDYKIPDEDKLKKLLEASGYEKVTVSEDNTAAVPEETQIELGAIGKGYAGDKACVVLKENGVASALLSLGGGIQLIGSAPDGGDWKIALKDPFKEGSFGTLAARGCSIITSGGYERYFTGEDGNTYCHILDPKTGKPVKSGLSSAVIISESGAYSDALSTAVFVMGAEKAEKLWRESGDFEMILVTDSGEILITENIEKQFTLNKDTDYKLKILNK